MGKERRRGRAGVGGGAGVKAGVEWDEGTRGKEFVLLVSLPAFALAGAWGVKIGKGDDDGRGYDDHDDGHGDNSRDDDGYGDHGLRGDCRGSDDDGDSDDAHDGDGDGRGGIMMIMMAWGLSW